MSAGELLIKLQTTLGYAFLEPKYLMEALTHSTFANENPEQGPDNERLEFLGDAILGLLAARLLFAEYGDAQEGQLSRHRSRVVCTETLAEMAEELGLAQVLRLGQGQKNDTSHVSKRTMAGAYEAVAAAVYLDGGESAVEKCYSASFSEIIHRTEQANDYKTQLQEICHARGIDAPRYVVSNIEGPDHARKYTCQVFLLDSCVGMGEGPGKKVAEQICAQKAIGHLETMKVKKEHE